MRRFLAGLLLLTLPLQAWNATGHRIVAAIAYDHLTPKAQARVADMLKRHPDFANLPSREAFLAAAVWPDTIKGDKRFYDDTKKDSQPAPLLPGFPSMARHTNWHYIDLPFSPDGTPLEQPPIPNALIELRRIIKEDLTPYDLPWLEHLTGDVHQPLHCTDRFTKLETKGDQGGNLVFVNPGRNLHALWDDLGGTDTSETYVNPSAAEITKDFVPADGRIPRLSRDPKRWVDEGFELAKRSVYTFGPETGSRDKPIQLTASYQAEARRIARVQLAKAGLRLAEVLNAKLGR